tara:strand:- start:43 stop:1602 length:1560 start_codon:yes stop_codon:yes gene_type:complete
LFLFGGKIMSAETFKKEIIEFIENYFDTNKLKSDASVDKESKFGKVIYIDYLNTKYDKLDELMVEFLPMGVFSPSSSKTPLKKNQLPKLKNKKTVRVKVGAKTPETVLVSFRSYEISSGKLPTAIQERGSTYVLDRVVRNRKRKFNTYKQFLNDTDIMDVLKEDVFNNYQDKVDEWLFTYYEQQRTFIAEYSKPNWEKFAYGNDDFVTFFSKYIIDPKLGLYNDFDEKIKVNKYTEWNPADIYAVKDMKKVKGELDEIFHKGDKDNIGASMVELNGYLMDMLKKKKLVGISLKKISDKTIGILEERNTKILKFKDPHVEDKNFTMSDIKFVIDNIWDGKFVSTTVKYGTSFSLSVRSSSSEFENLVFATQITGASAQGGNAPTDMVIKAIHANTTSQNKFENKNKHYPTTKEEFYQSKPSGSIKYTTSNYKTWFKDVSKKFTRSPKYEKFEDEIGNLYNTRVKKDAAIAQTKLMQLHFYYDTLKKYSNDETFWLRILYLGMKVGKIFAPHAKIYEKGKK